MFKLTKVLAIATLVAFTSGIVSMSAVQVDGQPRIKLPGLRWEITEGQRLDCKAVLTKLPDYKDIYIARGAMME